MCVEGGPIILGSRVPSWSGAEASTPERTAVVSTFLIDRTEVTVGRFRGVYESTLTHLVPPTLASEDRECTYTREPSGFDDHPVACVNWYVARLFCLAEGGDLVSEAQFEYPATMSNRSRKTRYPWGDDAPVCSCGDERPCHAPIIARLATTMLKCPGPFKPEPVLSASDPETGDVTPGGVIGLGGNVGPRATASSNTAKTRWSGRTTREVTRAARSDRAR